MNNQKDYKAIAEILKQGIINEQLTVGEIAIARVIAKELADYFEKDSYLYCSICGLETFDNEDFCRNHGRVQMNKGARDNNDNFDRKQFLKDCGVDPK